MLLYDLRIAFRRHSASVCCRRGVRRPGCCFRSLQAEGSCTLVWAFFAANGRQRVARRADRNSKARTGPQAVRDPQTDRSTCPACARAWRSCRSTPGRSGFRRVRLLHDHDTVFRAVVAFPASGRNLGASHFGELWRVRRRPVAEGRGAGGQRSLGIRPLLAVCRGHIKKFRPAVPVRPGRWYG